MMPEPSHLEPLPAGDLQLPAANTPGSCALSSDPGAVAGAAEAELLATRLEAPIDPFHRDVFLRWGYELRSNLGKGGEGLVYRALDVRRNEEVALKLLDKYDPDIVLRFRRGFRSLAGISHPNLVPLYRLISDGRIWFFTMKFVQCATTFDKVFRPRVGTFPPEEVEPLRDALRQVAKGIAALHRAGALHRDLKPSNVLVTPDRQVVIVDFGLAKAIAGDDSLGPGTVIGRWVGTREFMGPEQFDGKASAASDWYGFGGILYQALTGRPPFSGTREQIVSAKQAKAVPVPPSRLVGGVPRDLDELCAALLRPLPGERPTGQEVLRRLGVCENDDGPAREPVRIDRTAELEKLRRAWALADGGKTVAVLVTGESGAGKTALVNQFLEDLPRQPAPEPLVAQGSCHERESVPFNAVYSLVDELSLALSLKKDLAGLLPGDVSLLAELFPALTRVEAVRALGPPAVRPADEAARHHRTFAALHDLLKQLGSQRRLVVVLDDLQWGDEDSARQLARLLTAGDIRMLFIGCFRDGGSPFEQEFRPLLKELLPAECYREVPVGTLDPEKALGLARQLLTGQCRGREAHAEAVAAASQGVPFFIRDVLVPYVCKALDNELARYGVTLHRALEARLRDVPAGAYRLLEFVAISRQPIGEHEAYLAAVPPADRKAGQEQEFVCQLLDRRLVRHTDLAAQEIDIYRAELREVIEQQLRATPEAWRDAHRRLAAALEPLLLDDPERLGRLYKEAGDKEAGDVARACTWRACTCYVRAALRASGRSAVLRAAGLYREAFALCPPERPRLLRFLRQEYGDALAACGLVREAAAEYLAAADGAPGHDRLELRRRAAERMLQGGHIAEGLRLLRGLLEPLGLRLERRQWRALLGLVVRRVAVWWSGLNFARLPARGASEEELLRLDTCWSVATGLSIVDTFQAADLQARHLVLARRAGDPYRLARAEAVEAGFLATADEAGRLAAHALLEQARQRAEEVAHRPDKSHAEGMITLVEGLIAHQRGEWKLGADRCEAAEECFHRLAPRRAVSWELGTARMVHLACLYYRGDLKALRELAEPALADARQRGDIFTEVGLSTGVANVLHLAEDDPQTARAVAEAAMARFSAPGFHLQHLIHLLQEVQIDLYRGDTGAAADRLAREWRGLERSHLLRIQQFRVAMTELRARGALALAAARPGRAGAWLGRADDAARRLEGERLKWAAALARLVRAQAAHCRGNPQTAARFLQDAEERFRATDMALYAAAARRCLGELTAAAGLVETADHWMRGQGVADPKRLAAMLVPGLR